LSRRMPFLVLGLIFSGWYPISAPHLPGQASQETAAVKSVHTVVDMTPDELLAYYPAEINGLEFGPDREELGSLLAKMGERVEAFFRNFANTSSKEQVLLERLRSDGSRDASSRHEYNYLLLVHPEKTGIEIQEDRVDDRGRPISQKRASGFLTGSGFAGLSILLHPRHHYGSRFRYLGTQLTDPPAKVIAFAQKMEVGDYLAGISDPEFGMIPLLLQGIAWVDPDTYQIVRIRTDLLMPETRIALMRQTTDVRFVEVRFDKVPEPFWLPGEVTVTWAIKGTTYRSRHIYSGYKLFTIESYDKIELPKPK